MGNQYTTRTAKHSRLPSVAVSEKQRIAAENTAERCRVTLGQLTRLALARIGAIKLEPGEVSELPRPLLDHIERHGIVPDEEPKVAKG